MEKNMEHLDTDVRVYRETYAREITSPIEGKVKLRNRSRFKIQKHPAPSKIFFSELKTQHLSFPKNEVNNSKKSIIMKISVG